MGLWYNAVQILPDNRLEYSRSCVSAVRAPISLGIGPAEEFKIAVQLVGDISVYGYISTKITYLQKITKMKNGTSHPTYENKN